jgi:hypothetical protein
MFKSFNTRKRAIIVSTVIGVVIFLLTGPIIPYLTEVILPPSSVKNIKVILKNSEAEVSWDLSRESDIKGYKVSINNDETLLENNVDNTIISNLSIGNTYNAKFYSIDNTNKVSAPVEFELAPVSSTKYLEYNLVDNNSITLRAIIINSAIIFILLLVGNIWILFGKVTKPSFFTVGSFPSITLLPFLILSNSLLVSASSFTDRLIFSMLVSFVIVNITYLLILTSNILNGSLFNKIPLEQAGKASQFIFSLISSYLILIYAFSSNQNIIIRLLIALPFIFYFSYSAIWMNRALSSSQIFIRAFSITLLMAIGVMILSIWPIDSAYAILAASVIYYVLLNVALEFRPKLNRAVWVEYLVLVTLIIILLLTNGQWGINGTLV